MTKATSEAIAEKSNDSIADSKSSAWRRSSNAIILTAAGGSVVFEQSPLNEALRVNVALDVLQGTGSSLAVGATVFGITAAIEGVSSGLITAGLHAEGEGVKKLKDRLKGKKNKNQETVSEAKKVGFLGKMANFGSDVAVSLGLGAGIVTAKRHIASQNPTLKEDIKNSAKATTYVSTVSGGIGYLASGGIANAAKIGMETPAQYIIDYGTDTKFWMGVLVVGYGGYGLKRGVEHLAGRRRRPNDLPEQGHAAQ